MRTMFVIKQPKIVITKCRLCGHEHTWRAVDKITGTPVNCETTDAVKFAKRAGWTFKNGRGGGWLCSKCSSDEINLGFVQLDGGMESIPEEDYNNSSDVEVS